jgi:hypothetical protein
MSPDRIARLLLVLLLAACMSASPLDPAMRAVEQIRGRKFLEPVRNVTIDRSDLTRHLMSQMEQSTPYSLEEWGFLLKALQFIDVDATEALPRLLSLYESQVLAFYDPHSHTYYSIRQLPDLPEGVASIADPKMLEESVMVHELMHALQDQHFGLAAKTKALLHDTDASMAYHSVLEGEAVLVMIAHMLTKMGVTLDEAVKDAKTLEMLTSALLAEEMIDPSTPRYFVEMLKFPYVEGLKFVLAAYQRGGWKELDRIHANPPRSTREILNPNEYFNRTRKPEPFDARKPDGAIAVEHLGAFHWRVLVGEPNARGWVNDRVVVMKDGNVSIETRWESSEHAASFAAAYGKFLNETRGLNASVIHDGGTVRAAYKVER